MPTGDHDRARLHDSLILLLQFGPEVDVGHLLGLAHPLIVSTDALLAAVASHEEPTVRLAWDGGTLGVHRSDGGVTATLDVRF